MFIETDRLILRDFVEKDILQAADYLKDKEVMRYIEKPFTNEETRDFLNKYGINKSPIIYALYGKKEKKVIGHIIFHSFNSLDEYELGWIVGHDYWGNGYCFEISKAIIQYAFNIMKLKKVVCETVKENKKSLALIKKLDLSEEHSLDNADLITFCVRNPYED